MIWEADFSTKQKSKNEHKPSQVSSIDNSTIEALYLLQWREHCLECAIPQCYQTCRLYVPRIDLKCSRFYYGIYLDRTYKGFYPYGADIKFRNWGKVEAYLNGGVIKPAQLKALELSNRTLLKLLVNPVASLLQPLIPNRRLNRALVGKREDLFKFIGKKSSNESLKFDEFVMEAWNPSDSEFKLIIEATQEKIVYRDSFQMRPGHNLYRIPFNKMSLDLTRREGGIQLYPENDAEVQIVFTWLNFVRYRKSIKNDPSDNNYIKTQLKQTPKPAEKIKCVVWDLDNTLWDGILLEDGPEGIIPKENAIALIHKLDEMGILQSICSKNDYDFAWEQLEKLKLTEFFLYPAINWGPKSENIKEIAKILNIDINTFAFIDDSAFERSEVKNQFPQVRVYTENDVDSLLDLPEFDVPITETSRMRRASYMAEYKRTRIAKNYGEKYTEFLRSCNLTAKIFTPKSENDLKRSFELLQRTNQLNLTTYRYSETEFKKLVANPKYVKIVTRCEDKFGDYGLIGFASIEIKDSCLYLKDYVLSCRVAQKKLENAWFSWFQNLKESLKFDKIIAPFIPTERNKVLFEVLKEVGFEEVLNNNEKLILELPGNRIPPDNDLVKIEDFGVDFCRKPALLSHRK
jgi:FkbH-like protein